MITINHRDKIEWESGMTVRRVLEVCNFTLHEIMVVVNGHNVPREEYDTFAVDDEDEVQVIHFIGGG